MARMKCHEFHTDKIHLVDGMWTDFFTWGTYETPDNRTATYFFHKMADTISTYQQIIAMAPIPPTRKDDLITIGAKSLITGCNFDEVRTKLKKGTMFPRRALLIDYSTVYPCPMPPYKLYQLRFSKDFDGQLPPAPTGEGEKDIYAVKRKGGKQLFLGYLEEHGIGCMVCGEFASFVCSGCELEAYCGEACQANSGPHSCIKTLNL